MSMGAQHALPSLQRRLAGLRLQPARQPPRVRLQPAPARAATATQTATAPLRDAKGADVGTAEIAVRVAGNRTATGLVHRYLVMAQQNGRRGTASTKTRAEVRGGGKKPYKQKATGNARQGSIRTPLKPGGGVVFGPKPKDWSIKMNRKERRLALSTALHNAAGSTIVVKSLKDTFAAGPKTRLMIDTLAAVGASPDERTLLILNEADDNLLLSARNIRALEVNFAPAISIYNLLRADRIVVEEAALEYINEFYA